MEIFVDPAALTAMSRDLDELALARQSDRGEGGGSSGSPKVDAALARFEKAVARRFVATGAELAQLAAGMVESAEDLGTADTAAARAYDGMAADH